MPDSNSRTAPGFRRSECRASIEDDNNHAASQTVRKKPDTCPSRIAPRRAVGQQSMTAGSYAWTADMYNSIPIWTARSPSSFAVSPRTPPIRIISGIERPKQAWKERVQLTQGWPRSKLMSNRRHRSRVFRLKQCLTNHRTRHQPPDESTSIHDVTPDTTQEDQPLQMVCS